MEITTVGIDLAKSIFQVHAVDAAGQVVVRKALRRAQVVPFFAKLPPCLVGMEACGTSHHWARELIRLGHDVRLMPPAYVKPYVKRGKTDANDAAAICEAVTRPSMRFVPVKSTEQAGGAGAAPDARPAGQATHAVGEHDPQPARRVRDRDGAGPAPCARTGGPALGRRRGRGATPGPAGGDRAGRSDRRRADPAHPAGEGVVGLASGQRPVAAPGDDSGCRHRLGDRAGRFGERARALPQRSTVRRLVGG